MIKVLVCHRPDGLEVKLRPKLHYHFVCHRPDGLEGIGICSAFRNSVCHRPDGLEESGIVCWLVFIGEHCRACVTTFFAAIITHHSPVAH